MTNLLCCRVSQVLVMSSAMRSKRDFFCMSGRPWKKNNNSCMCSTLMSESRERAAMYKGFNQSMSDTLW